MKVSKPCLQRLKCGKGTYLSLQSTKGLAIEENFKIDGLWAVDCSLCALVLSGNTEILIL